MSTLKKGTTVSWPAPKPHGVVERAQVSEGGEDLMYLVNFTDAAGAQQQRWFHENELSVVTPSAG